MKNILKADESKLLVPDVLGIDPIRKSLLQKLARKALNDNDVKTIVLKIVIDETETFEEAVFIAFFIGSIIGYDQGQRENQGGEMGMMSGLLEAITLAEILKRKTKKDKPEVEKPEPEEV